MVIWLAMRQGMHARITPVLPYINSHDIAKFEVKWRNRDNYNRVEMLVIFHKKVKFSNSLYLFKEKLA